MDKVYGGGGDDTISTANIPASRDVVNCGGGTDKVSVDSLDEVADCEDVKKIQEKEPNLADGTYQLVPTTSSECDLGEGSFTLSTDPSTGERGVEVNLDPAASKDTTADQACGVKIDYQNPVPAQGTVSAQDSDTYSYEGTKPTQQKIDEVKKEAQNVAEEPASSTPPPQDVSAQYAWTFGAYNVVVTTEDIAYTDLNRTWHKLRWWYNGYSVDYSYPSRSCWAAYPSRFNTYWYNSWCDYTYRPYNWYGYNSYLSWIGSEVQGYYYNEDFPNGYGYRDGYYTYAWHKSRIWGYNNGLASYSPDWQFSGQYWWILYHYIYAYRG